MAAPFVVLVVCRANVCRSPLAAALLERYVHDAVLGDAVAVRSGGTAVLDALPMCVDAAEWGAVELAHISAPVTHEDLVAADLILAVDRENRAACAILEPGCRPRMFTLRQAAALAELVGTTEGIVGEPADQLRWLVGEWDGERALLAGRDEELDDIEDRHGPGPHEEVFDEVDEASRAVATALQQVCLR